MGFLLVRFSGLLDPLVVQGSVRLIHSMGLLGMLTQRSRSLLVPRFFRMA